MSLVRFRKWFSVGSPIENTRRTQGAVKAFTNNLLVNCFYTEHFTLFCILFIYGMRLVTVGCAAVVPSVCSLLSLLGKLLTRYVWSFLFSLIGHRPEFCLGPHCLSIGLRAPRFQHCFSTSK